MLLLLLLGVLLPAQMPAAPAHKPRAIILMLADDFGYGNVGFAHGPSVGNPEARTPNLDGLARSGVVLDRMYTYKYCSPSRSSLLTGRIAPHVNQNNLANHVQSSSGADLRMTLLPHKMRMAGYYTAMVGKAHLGARSPSNLPANRGFDYHFGFLTGGPDHYTQETSLGKLDMWEGQALSNETGIYTDYLFTQKAVDVIHRAAWQKRDLFLYMAWHNTHHPNECPSEFMYPALPTFNDSDPERMKFNCMARLLDAGVGNITDALKEVGMWEDTLLWFAADNGGWLECRGASNFPLRGGKNSDFEGGVRAVSFLAGGLNVLPAAVRGGVHTGYISLADWYGTLANLVGVNAADDVEGLPPVDSNDFWPSILVPNATSSGRDDVWLSWSCAGHDETYLCTRFDRSGGSIYNTSGDPTAKQGEDDKAYIWRNWKIVVGRQNGMGVWTGPVSPNVSLVHLTDESCVRGCLFDIWKDPTEHNNLKASYPGIWAKMLGKLLKAARTLYQTDYGEPDVTCVPAEQADKYYVGHNTCPPNVPGYRPSAPRCQSAKLRTYLGPMCFKKLPIFFLPPPTLYT